MKLGRILQVCLALFGTAAAILLYGPVILAVLLSFFTMSAGHIQWDTFGLQNYVSLASNAKIGSSLLFTVTIGFCTVVLSVVLALGFALFARQETKLGVRLQTALLSLPFVAPPVITGLALLIFFRQASIERSTATIVIAHTIFVLALVYRIIHARLSSLGGSIFEAAEDLGASDLQIVFGVVLPNMWGAIGAAGALAFALSFDETLITLLVTGTQMTLPVRLWSMMRLGFSPDINALVTLILAISVVATAFAMRGVGKKSIG